MKTAKIPSVLLVANTFRRKPLAENQAVCQTTTHQPSNSCMFSVVDPCVFMCFSCQSCIIAATLDLLPVIS